MLDWGRGCSLRTWGGLKILLKTWGGLNILWGKWHINALKISMLFSLAFP